MKNEGIVVKVTEKHIVLLTPGESSFKNIPRNKDELPQLGEKYIYEEKRNPVLGFRWMAFSAAAACLLVVIACLSLIRPFQTHPEYVVAMDINPSIEVYADKKLLVTSLKPLNPQGEHIVSRISYKGKNVTETVKMIIDECVQERYLRSDKSRLITTSIIPMQESNTTLNKEQIQTAILGSLSTHAIPVRMNISMDTKQTLEAAHEMNLSINKFKVYNQLKENGIDFPIEKLKVTPIGKLLRLNGIQEK